MINSTELFRPQVRADIVFGPPMLYAGATVYYIKDTLTGQFYRIGAKEHFLISRMDGTRTLEQIEAEYRLAFNRRLSPQSWGQLFSLLNKRSLLAGTSDIDRLRLLKREEEKGHDQSVSGRRLSIVQPDRLLEKILPWLRFAFHPAFVYPALAAILILEVFFFFNVGTAVAGLLPDLGHYFSLQLVLLLGALVCIFLATHEFAHGLACKYFGGSVPEIGIIWRAPFLYAYCKIDDVVLFHNRWHRVYTAFAGIFVNLLMVIPFALLWRFSPEHSFAQVIGAFVLVFVNLFTLANLVPFVELDGYLMLKYALNVLDLREHASRIWYSHIRKGFFRGSDHPADLNGRSSQRIYLVYGVCSLIYLLLFVGFLLFLLVTLLQHVIT